MLKTILSFSALDDLVVTMDQLEYLLSCIREKDLLTESADYVISIKERIVTLNNMIDTRAGKVKIRSLNEALTPKEDDNCTFSATPISRAVVPRHDDDSDSSCSDDSFVSAAESIPYMVCYLLNTAFSFHLSC